MQEVEHKVVLTLSDGSRIKTLVYTEGEGNPAPGINKFLNDHPELISMACELVDEWPEEIINAPLYGE